MGEDVRGGVVWEAAKEAEDGSGGRGRGCDGEGACDGEEGGRTGGREELSGER